MQQQQLQDDEVFGDMFRSEEKHKKKKSTDMLLTMNLNEKFATMTTERKQLFKNFAVSLFDDKRILEYFKDKMSPANPLANMDHVDIKWKPEVGSKTGRLHLHALVSIEHHGWLSFRANDLREAARQYFGHAVHLSCPLSSNEKVKWENYIMKGFEEINP